MLLDKGFVVQTDLFSDRRTHALRNERTTTKPLPQISVVNFIDLFSPFSYS